MEDINKELALINRKISRVLGDDDNDASSVAPGYLLIDDNTIIDSNPVAEGYIGIKKPELIGKSFTEILNNPLSPEFNAGPVIDFINDKTGGKTFSFDWVFRAPDEGLSEYTINISRIGEHHIVLIIPAPGVADHGKGKADAGGHFPGNNDFSSQTTILFRMSDQRNQCYYFSKQWLRFTGKKLKEELNEGWTNHIYADDFDRVIETISRAFDRQLKYEISYRLVRTDSDIRLMYESGIPLYDIDGNFIGYLSVSVDFTKAKEDPGEDVFINEQTFKTLAENAPVLFKMSDENGKFFYFSKQWIGFTGRSLKDESGQKWMRFVHNDDYKTLKECLDESLRIRKKFEITYRIRDKEGIYRWIFDMGIPVFGHMGQFTGFISASLDITENKKEEDKKNRQLAFRESESKLQLSLDNSNLIALSVNKAGEVTYCNRYFLELTGLEIKEVIGAEFYRFFGISAGSDGDKITLERYFLNPGFSSGFEAYTQNSFREKFIIRFSSVIFFGEINEPDTITLVGENITERKKIREALESSNAQLKDFLDNANDLVQIFTPDGNFLFVNKIWKNKLGYDDNEIPTLSFRNTIHPEFLEATINKLDDVAAGKSSSIFETDLLSKSGQRIHVSGSINCSFKDGKVKEFRAIMYDISDKVRAEKAQNLYHNIANLTIQSSDLNSFFRSIHNELNKIIFAKNLYIALLDPTGRELSFAYMVDENLSKEPLNVKREFGNGLTEYIIGTRKSFCLTEPEIKDLEEKKLIRVIGSMPKTWLGAPLWLGERIIGVIAVQNYSETEIYSANDLEILEFLSGQIALSIERKQNEAQIKDHAARQQAIFESTSHLIWSVDKNNHVTSSNKNYDIFRENYIPAPLKEDKKSSVRAVDPEQYWGEKYAVAFNGKSHRFEAMFINLHDHTSTWKDVVVYPIIPDSGIVEEVSCIAHDITEKKQSELALKESEEKFRDIFESFQDLYFRCDFRGNIIMLSPSVTEILGYSPGEVIGTDITNYYLYTKKTKDLLRQIVKRKNVRNFEASVVAKNGNILQCICNIRLVYDTNFKAVALEGVARDITQIKEAHSELKQAKEVAEKSLKVKESFLANMSHEIRTPMNGIIGMIDMLENSGVTEEQKNYILTIKKSSETLLNILNDILDLSKIEAGKMQLRKRPVQIVDLMEKLVALFSQQAATRNIHLNYSINEKVPEYLMIDETRILQILSNLTSNAIKFTEGGGSIDINLKKTKVPGKSNMYRCAVSDSGIGISPDNLKKLFTSFSQLDTSTTKPYSGTGLGLAISKELCKLMGGKISVYSTMGLGSTFWFTFQAESAEKKMIIDNRVFENDIRIEGYFDKDKVSVLLVDDNVVNRQVAFEILKKSGCRVDIASDGREALERVKNGNYDLIFMDIQMPDMDGVTATNKIKSMSLKKLPPIIAMTAYSMKEDRDRFISQGLDDYIAKPIRATELINKVRQWVRDEIIVPQDEDSKSGGKEIINRKIVEQLVNLGGADMVETVFGDFIDETKEQIRICFDSASRSDYGEIQKQLHTLKGNSGTLGIDKVSSLAAEIESKLKKQHYESIVDDLNFLNLAFGEFMNHYPGLLK